MTHSFTSHDSNLNMLYGELSLKIPNGECQKEKGQTMI
jgi:hypothetical protein